MYAVIVLSGLCSLNVNAQITDTTNYNYGVWQTFGDPLSSTKYPELRGRLCNFRWADLEPTPNGWNWTQFDSDLTSRAADGLPITFMVYTGQDAPDWIYTTGGVPKVPMTDNLGNLLGYAPYYQDPEYKSLFKQMITAVHQHVETLPSNVRNKIVAVQGCYGSTGDYISYKGNVPSQYYIDGKGFQALFQEFSQYTYDEYKNTNPKIYLLSNPQNNGQDQCTWLTINCPGSWIKTGSLGKGFELNDEKTKFSWLFPLMNTPMNGNYMRSRSEIIGANQSAGWWTSQPYKNMFALLCYDIHWGLDWNNQSIPNITDAAYNPAFDIYNKYAGEKDPATSNYAICALKDVIDASDAVRFPSSTYGTVARTTTRFKNVLAPFIAYGAKLEDPSRAVLTEQDNLVASGINDVGWDLLPGNYERYLHQIDPNGTSIGYWNVQSADLNTIYGKYARSFDVVHGKTAMYFDVDDAFLNYAALNSAYPVMIEVTYLDKGTGSWQLFYDSKSNSNKGSITVTCANTMQWKKASITLNDAYFGNRSTNSSDFYIKSVNNQDVIFTVVELSRTGTAGNGSALFYSGPLSFDTLCINSSSNPQQVNITGQYLDNSAVTIGPLKGFSFSTTSDGVYADSIIVNNYGAALAQSVFIKFNPTIGGSYNGNIPVSGGGASKINVGVTAYGMDGNPKLTAAVKNVTCYNAKNGSINLTTTGGSGTFSYSWVSSSTNFKSTSQNISALVPSTYTVTINAGYGCTSSASYTITQPDVLVTSVSSDPMTCKGTTTNVYVNAKGGTTPYKGTGTFTMGAGWNTYTVTDANGCSDSQGYSVANGTLTIPVKPGTITGTDITNVGACGAGNFTFSISSVANATSYTWTPPVHSTVGSLSNGGTQMILNTDQYFTGGTLSVTASNVCGSSVAQTKTLDQAPAKPGAITGPTTVQQNQKGLVYSVPAISGVTYSWVVPYQATITAGQGTNKITVNWGMKDGTVKVKAVNDCASSYYQKLSVTATANFAYALSGQIILTQTVDTTLVYPNPAKDFAFVSLFAYYADRKFTIQVTDMMGRPVITKDGISQKGANRIMLDTHLLTKGMYIVTIYNEVRQTLQKTKLVKG